MQKIFEICKKIFEKTIDKSIKVWYNIITEREQDLTWTVVT